MVKNKRGRKGNHIPGYADRYVDTWILYNGEWIYQGQSRKKVAGVVNDGEYSYYSTREWKVRQAM